MSLPSRYSSNSERKHVHLRLTYDMWVAIADDSSLGYVSVPEKIRRMILERYPQISSGSPREKEKEK